MNDPLLDEVVSALLNEKPDSRTGLWMEDECYRYYVQQRREHCAPNELMGTK